MKWFVHWWIYGGRQGRAHWGQLLYSFWRKCGQIIGWRRHLGVWRTKLNPLPCEISWIRHSCWSEIYFFSCWLTFMSKQIITLTLIINQLILGIALVCPRGLLALLYKLLLAGSMLSWISLVKVRKRELTFTTMVYMLQGVLEKEVQTTILETK